MHTDAISAPGRARSTADPLRRVFLMCLLVFCRRARRRVRGPEGAEQVRRQDKYVDKKPGQHIIVDLDSGVAVGITQPPDQSLRVGDAVAPLTP